MVVTQTLTKQIFRAGDQVGTVSLLEPIGKGGQAEIWSGWDFEHERIVAVKLIQLIKSPGEERASVTAADFEREAHLVASLSHPYILPLYDFGTHEKFRYFVMRYAPGGALDDRLDGNPFPVKLAIKVMGQMASALAYIHARQIVHRDVKPGNIFQGATGDLYLGDFGLAKALSDVTMAMHTGRGTPRYAPPEQHTRQEITPRTDIYSLGLVIYELLTGGLPWEGDTSLALAQIQSGDELPDPRELNPDLPAELAGVLRHITAIDPADRPASVLEAYQLVADVFDDRTPVPDPETPAPDDRIVAEKDARVLLRIALKHGGDDPAPLPLSRTTFALIDSVFAGAGGQAREVTAEIGALLLRGALVHDYHADLWWYRLADPALRLRICEQIVLGEGENRAREAIHRLAAHADHLPLEKLSRAARERLIQRAADTLNPDLSDDALQVAAQGIERSAQWGEVGLSPASDASLVKLVREGHPQAEQAARLIGRLRSAGAVARLVEELDAGRLASVLSTIRETAGRLPPVVPGRLRWQIMGQQTRRRLAQDQVTHTWLRLLLGVGAALLVSLAMLRGMFRLPNLQLGNLLYQPYPVSGIVTIVGIDDASLNQYGRWDEWPRELHVDLINRLHEAGARAIALDIVFPTGTADDAELAAAIAEAGNVVQTVVGVGDAYLDGSGVATYERGLLPLPELLAASRTSGHANVLLDPDGYIRRMPLVIGFDGEEVVSLPVQTIRVFLGVESDSIPTMVGGHFDVAGRRIPVDPAGSMWIRYAGPPLTEIQASHRWISYRDVLAGNYDPALFDGKIVLVGMVATAEPDRYLTPSSEGRLMYGVEVLANTIETIWAQRFIRFPPEWTQAALLVGLGLLIGLVGERPWLSLVTAGLVLMAYYLFASLLFDGWGVMLSLFYPALAILLSYGVVTSYRLSQEIQRRRQVIQLFEDQAPASVAYAASRAVRRGELRLSRQIQTVSVVSFWLASYRAYTEAHGAAAGAALIDRFNRLLTDVVFAYEGTLVPGDSQQVIAIFNAPLQQPDHAYRAVRTALDAHQRFRTHHPDLPLAAGIYTGRAMVGSRGRGLYTALGEPVDLAVQIARGGQAGQTLLGLPTYEAVEDLVTATLAPLITIEGQASPVVVYAVRGEG